MTRSVYCIAHIYLQSKELNDLLTNEIMLRMISYSFIGLSDVEDEGVWKHADGETSLTFSAELLEKVRVYWKKFDIISKVSESKHY